MKYYNPYFKTIREWASLWEYSFWYERIGIILGIAMDIVLYALIIACFVGFIMKIF